MPDGEHTIPKANLLNAAGAHFHMQGQLDAARMHYCAALMSEPDHPLALQNLCGCITNFDLFEAAVAIGRRAVRADPTNWQAKMNLAAALSGVRQFSEAKWIMESLFKIEDMTERPELWHNYGLALYLSGNRRDAMDAFDKSSALRSVPVVEGDRSICTLSLGMIGEGMRRYDACRWELLKPSKIWEHGIPEWKGEPLDGKTLVVHHEQGFGDSIMFARFIPRLQTLGATVVVAVPAPLIRLIEFSFPDVRVIDWGSDHIIGDFHSPFMSVMRWLGIEPENISPAPYLRSGLGATQVPVSATLKVGICWESGNHGKHLQKSRREVPLELFFKISELEGVRLVSLQKGDAQNQILAKGAESFIYDPMGRCDDFADTAAIISGLDLIISVDSAVVHLAGGLGKPVIMLGPYTRCWRWWGEKIGLPWYDDFVIFPQSSDGTWGRAVANATEAVGRMVRQIARAA